MPKWLQLIFRLCGFSVLEFRLKRWDDRSRVKFADQAPDDERLIEFCRDFGDLMANKKLDLGEEWEMVGVFKRKRRMS